MAPLFRGCDYGHWLIVMDKPGGEGSNKQQMINCYIETLAKVVGSGNCILLMNNPASSDILDVATKLRELVEASYVTANSRDDGEPRVEVREKSNNSEPQKLS
ncbi:hypothetical protein Nepgr_004407 [Nepenthes gracilis]|uniref:MORF/ORRM1/DAG-like MORF domain-containing protein n=1 Tax=Nepenthes gracilis TaxID=150966 RepID=A0AAD3S1D2_NEPGR|nr:hypothetical protein Nepgr_004407 [Nepenthes gracilis]